MTPLKYCFWPKYKSIIHKKRFLQSKSQSVVLSLQNLPTLFVSSCFGLCAWSVHISLLMQTRWTEDSYFSQKQRFDVWNILMDSFPTNTQLFTSLMDWSCVDYFSVLGLSFWRHPFTAEHPLMNKWRKATFPKETLIYILDGLRASTFPAHLYFGVNVGTSCSCLISVLLNLVRWGSSSSTANGRPEKPHKPQSCNI